MIPSREGNAMRLRVSAALENGRAWLSNPLLAFLEIETGRR